ncbi:LysR family transcriptional regulator [Rhizorhabdus histidinilytica]|uniref:DNA-binding transcriptional regulator, LysR family n=1 Tax=Rhizorhabdus histidinilytica TaxID=439228 RepID=A0A1T5BKV6_9SPHN|nr:LysR family transcriptional regulator [Rhizorhabdus histidinilytica]SKB47924.1 DNA-binding transcriptional regulator, LysR family [Rhizorhabdus histidinilytica]
MNVTLKQIRAFVAIVDTGSFTAAATAVNSTQSSLSVLMRELETAVGVRLLERTTRTVQLTEAGEEFMAHARRILIEVENALTSADELVARKRGRVTVAAPPVVAALMLPSVIARFRATYPNIVVMVEDITPQEIVARVASGQADCGLGTFAGELKDVHSRRLIDEELVLICPSTHPLAQRREIRSQDLRDVSIVGLAGSPDVRRSLDVRLRLAGVHVPPAIEVRQMFTSLGMVGAGLGVAIWPSWATRILPAFNVVARPLVDPPARFTISVITPARRTLSPATQSFVEMLSETGRDFTLA